VAEYKIIDNDTVVRIGDGCAIPRGNSLWRKYEEWVAAGGIPDPAHTDDELLEMAKAAKISDLEAAASVDMSAPVSVGGCVFSGGLESARNLDGQWRMARDYVSVHDPLITTVDFFQADGTVCTVPITSDTEIDAADIVAAVSQRVSVTLFKLADFKRTVAMATDITSVNGVAWG